MKTMSAGSFHTVAIKNDGTLWAWGSNNFGQLGDGTDGTGSEKTYPVQVSEIGYNNAPISGDKWIAVSAGAYHTVAIRNDGTLWAWGDNRYGQLGDGTSGSPTNDKSRPVQVSETDFYNAPISGDKWIAVSAGFHYTLAIRNDDTLWAWGYNEYGQLGDNTIVNRNRPVQVSETDFYNAPISGDKWIVVSTTYVHTVAIRNDGTLWAWGRNTDGQLGDGTSGSPTNDKSRPVQVSETDFYNAPISGDKWISVFSGSNHTVAIRNDGTLWAWGDNLYGQLGLGDSGTGTNRNTPTLVGGNLGWASVSGGEYHTIAHKRDGTLWAWGMNGSGQLGFDSAEEDVLEPKRIGVAADLIGTSAGYFHSTALRRSGILWTWGYNNYGQLGNDTIPTTGLYNYSPKPIAVKWK